MRIRHLICAYPWDFVGDPAAPDRARAVNAGAVVIAAAYHSVRAATPRHPRHLLVDAPTAAFYLPVRPSAWKALRLRPVSGALWAGEDSFRRAADAAGSGGLDVHAWVVLTHATVLGRAHPDLCVRNAGGDIYAHALCPSSVDVREYAARLVEETVALSGVESLMIEACGPMGFDHLGHHEKTSGADWTAVDRALLSLCFCERCRDGLAAHGQDPDVVRRRTLSAIGSGAPTVEEAIGDASPAVLAVRDRSRAQLAQAVAEAARGAGARSLAFHVQPGAWATGPFAALLDRPGLADGFVLPVDQIVALGGHARGSLPDGERLGAYVPFVPPISTDPGPGPVVDALRGVDDVYSYHFGLLSPRRLDDLALLVESVLSTG